MIPLYGGQAGGGKIYSLDDPNVVTDGAALDGTGGTAFVPFLVSTSLLGALTLGFNALRRFFQRVAHDGTATFRFTPFRDGQQSGTGISRTVLLSDPGPINVPLNEPGSDFHMKIEVLTYSAPVALGDAGFIIVPGVTSRPGAHL